MKSKVTPDAVMRSALADLFERDATELASIHPTFAAELKTEAKELRVQAILINAVEISTPRRAGKKGSRRE